MKLPAESFTQLADGIKTIEARLLDEKRRALNVGDTIIFESRGDGSRLTATIADLIVMPSFEALYDLLGPEPFGWKTTAEGLAALNEYYTPEQQSENDVVGIVLTNIQK